jgi:dihydrodipicolinate synthase/N-acetylneuraminate lyase
MVRMSKGVVMKVLPSVIVPIITPFANKGTIYEKGIKNLLTFLNEKGIRGVWILGSYGSFPLLSVEERKRVAEITLKAAEKLDMFSIVQIGSPGIKKALELADHAQRSGADAIATVLPYYYSSASYREANFFKYFKTLLESVGLPLIYYNNPKTTGFTPSSDFVRKLLQLGVLGMKDTTTDFLAINKNIQAFEDESPEGFYMGGSASVFLPARIMGASSVVCGTAVSMPELVLRLDSAVKQKDWAKSKKFQHLLIRARSIQSRYVGRSMACYGILSGRGIDVGQCRLPWIGMTTDQQEDVLKELRAIGAIPRSRA